MAVKLGDRVRITNIAGADNRHLNGKEGQVIQIGAYIRVGLGWNNWSGSYDWALVEDGELEIVGGNPIPQPDWEALPDSVKSWIHDLETEADPAGTLRQLRLLQDAFAAQETLIDELKAEITALKEGRNG